MFVLWLLGPPKANSFGCQPACWEGGVGFVRSVLWPLEPHWLGPWGMIYSAEADGQFSMGSQVHHFPSLGLDSLI